MRCAPRIPKYRALDSKSPIWQCPIIEIVASSFKLRANARGPKKRFPINSLLMKQCLRRLPLRHTLGLLLLGCTLQQASAANLTAIEDAEGVELDLSAPIVQKTETPEQRNARMAWWREARFGMFIHWGVYANAPKGCWHMRWEKTPVAAYKESFGKQFNPTQYDPAAWVKLAKQSGMKYIVITAKHHDGFALWPSKASTWNVADATPWAKDLLAPLADACRKEGIKFGLYYSHSQDWAHPGGSTSEGNWDPAQAGDYDTYISKIAAAQIGELASAYQPDVFWWDTPVNITKERADKLIAPLSHLGGLITNERLGSGHMGDYNVQENIVPSFPLKRDWETCMTIGRTWNYSPYDKNFKSAEELVRKLSEIASKGGNLLLNVGPKPDGTIPELFVERLQSVGQWLERNGEAIYGTVGGPFPYLSYGYATRKGDKLNVIVFDWPKDGQLRLPVLSPAKGARLLGSSLPLEVKNEDQRVVVSLPEQAPDPIASVVVLEFDGEPVARPNPTLNAKVKASANEAVAANVVKFVTAAPWITPKGTTSATLEFTLEKPTAIASVRMDEPDKWPRVRQDVILEAQVDGVWKKVAEASTEGVGARADFPPVTTGQLKLTLIGKTGAPGLAKILFLAPE